MNRFFCIFLLFAIMSSLFGCSSADSSRVAFYYSRDPAQYQYFEEDSVIHAEIRDLTGHYGDLRYMVGLYLAGPLDESLVIPFTKATRLLSVEEQDGCLTINLSEHTKNMTDSEFSLACACLTLTCIQDSSYESVTIISGSRSVTMTADSIVLHDILPAQETTGG